ncbi:hypothetical protein EDC04DRAFT_2661731 [Pisolithus marmoratus]|nr:hypothetical protein EDC04DRAFT_2778024 [Pisolithus marmoratus]KAI6042244.1 hypothetical protein EDC04DRAFT_2661731 [Pisolithus marmoratus]
MVNQRTPERHHVFYFHDGTHIFRVRNVLFKVHKNVLSDKSITFKTIFDAEVHADVLPIGGLTDNKAILVPEQISDDAFELFLSVCYNKWRPDVSEARESTVLELLELSRMYESQDVRNHAIKHLFFLRHLIEPIKLTSIALKYHIKVIFCYAFRRLLPLRVNDLKDSEFKLLSNSVWITLFRVRERLDVHRRVVAMEPPRLVHSVGCEDHRRCLNDWNQVWWNGMGRLLMDGRNPQPFDSAIHQFQSLSYGDMSPECWREMIKLVKEGRAFLHEEDLIDRTVLDLAEVLVNEPLLDDAIFS